MIRLVVDGHQTFSHLRDVERKIDALPLAGYFVPSLQCCTLAAVATDSARCTFQQRALLLVVVVQ
jgi:hypothetical protein